MKRDYCEFVLKYSHFHHQNFAHPNRRSIYEWICNVLNGKARGFETGTCAQNWGVKFSNSAVNFIFVWSSLILVNFDTNQSGTILWWRLFLFFLVARQCELCNASHMSYACSWALCIEKALHKVVNRCDLSVRLFSFLCLHYEEYKEFLHVKNYVKYSFVPHISIFQLARMPWLW